MTPSAPIIPAHQFTGNTAFSKKSNCVLRAAWVILFLCLPGASWHHANAAEKIADAASATPELRFDELYATYGVLGLEFSAKAKSLALAGKTVRVLGYLAPPLKAEAAFFVLMRAPASVCPFCSTDADWPVDIMVVYPRSIGQQPHSAAPMAITGRLELGSKIDRVTGFVSQVRIVDAEYQKLR